MAAAAASNILRQTSFDDLLVDLGQFGRYQKRIYTLLFLPTIFNAMHKLSWVFLGARTNHRCRLPTELDNEASYFPSNNSLRDQLVWDEHEGRFEQCFYLKAEGNETTECDQGWVYDRSVFGSSAVMDYDLVCDNKPWRATAQAIFMVGVLMGSYIFGDLSDRFGRKPVFFASVMTQTVFGLAAGFAPEYWSFVLLRMIVGMTTSGVFLVSYVLAMEMVGPARRVIAGTLCQYYYTFGLLGMALIAYFLNYDWQLLQIVLTLPTILFLSYWWIMPESVRWLIQKGKYELAREQIEVVAKENGVDLSQAKVEAMMESEMKKNEKQKALRAKSSILDLLRTPNLRSKTLKIFFIWFVNSGTYYGLSLGASDLGGNPYINFMLTAAVEAPAYLLNLFLLNQPKIGRRLSLTGTMLVVGLALLSLVFVPAENRKVIITLSMLGKLAITSSYGIVYLFSAELFPTEVRNVAMGGASMSAGMGGILCSYVNLLNDIWHPLPPLFYGVLAIIAGLLALLLPETQGKILPETMTDAEEFGKKTAKAINTIAAAAVAITNTTNTNNISKHQPIVGGE